MKSLAEAEHEHKHRMGEVSSPKAVKVAPAPEPPVVVEKKIIPAVDNFDSLDSTEGSDMKSTM